MIERAQKAQQSQSGKKSTLLLLLYLLQRCLQLNCLEIEAFKVLVNLSQKSQLSRRAFS